MDFWKSAGMHLVSRDDNGYLRVTPDYLRAYFTRPEIHPIETSCVHEHALFEKLMGDPFVKIDAQEIQRIADEDARDNYQVILRFRDHLAQNGTIEAAYKALFLGERAISIPPIFIDQMVHLILRNIFAKCEDPFVLRAAELFFREQVATLSEDQLMLADQEIVEMRAQNDLGGLGQLLAESGTPTRQISLDVMSEDNCSAYWQRSDNFDMAIDFRFTQAAPDALAQVIKSWVKHFFGIETRVTAMKSIRDERWSWHIGCDAQSTRILNSIYNGEELAEPDLIKIIALYRMEFIDDGNLIDTMAGKPIYLGLAINDKNQLIFKPQNLLINLPIKNIQ